MVLKAWKAYLEPTPKNVKKWLLAVKSIVGVCAGSAYFTDHAQAGFWMLVAGAIVNELGNLLADESN